MGNGPTPVKHAYLPAQTATPMHTETEQYTLRITYESSYRFSTRSWHLTLSGETSRGLKWNLRLRRS
jgi:hypothetical protein